MGIYLYLIKTDFWYYDKNTENKDEIKSYKFKSLDDALKFGQFFIENDINNLCNSTLGPYDVDFFDSDQCKILKKWIHDNDELIRKAELIEQFKVVDNFCDEAIKLGTGIEIEC